MKRILSLVLVFVMFSAVSVSALANDEKLSLLSDLGIFEGYEDGDFKLDETLTRAQAAAVIVRLMNKADEAVNGETVFSDVASSHWASGYINKAYEDGIINGFGDGTFRPEDKVTYHQFIKMLCCVLGYDIAAEKTYGGWENGGYIKIADIIRITKNIEFEKDAFITRHDVAQMSFEALDIELMDENSQYTTNGPYEGEPKETLLTEKFDIKNYVFKIKDANGAVIIRNRHITGAEVRENPLNDGQIHLNISLTEEGQEKLSIATRKAAEAEAIAAEENYICVYIDDELISKPFIFFEISSDSFTLVGDFSKEMAGKWAKSINVRRILNK